MSDDDDFKKGPDRAGSEARLAMEAEAPNLEMFEREDWSLFRTVEGLMQKAGVPVKYLRRLILKELADNALDTGSSIKVGSFSAGRHACYFIEDAGPGLDGEPQDIAALFSIARPLRSTKLLRLPQPVSHCRGRGVRGHSD